MRIIAGEDSFKGNTAVEVVSNMRELYNRANLPQLDSNEDYMLGVIKRIDESGLGFSGETEEEKCSSFIQSLIDAHVVMEVAE